MTLDYKLLDLLCCPVSHKPLKPASDELLTRIRHLCEADESQWPQALVTLDERRAYPVRNGIPVLLPEAALELSD